MKPSRKSPRVRNQPCVADFQQFDAHLKAYSATGRAALAVGAALGATTVMEGQVTNLVFSSFSTTPTATITTQLSKNEGPTGTATDIAKAGSATVDLTHFGDFTNPARAEFKLYVYQKNAVSGTQRHASGVAELVSLRNMGFVKAGTTGQILKKMDAGSAVNGAAQWSGRGVGFATSATRAQASFPIGEKYGDAQFTDSQPGYMGFRVKKSAGHYYYGWMRVQVTKADGRPVSIALVAQDGIYGAFNATLGGAITAGETAAVPEPASAAAGLALFALGAAGVREFRRRRKAAERDAVRA